MKNIVTFSMNNESNTTNEISVFCIIVTYNPDKTHFEKILNELFKQVKHIVIVDNGSGPQTINWLKSHPKYQIIEMGFNAGVGAAQNQGIRYAQTQGCSHVLLMDQDSLPSENMVANLMLASSHLKRYRGQSVMVGPRIFDPRIGEDFPFVRFGYGFVKRDVCPGNAKPRYVRTDFLISSGTLIPMDVIQQVGVMDETLFIDNVDLEWGFRAQQKGVWLYGVCNAFLEHHLGDRVVELKIGRGVRIYQHPPVRQYYMIRNRILLYQRPYTPWGWIIQDFLRMLLKLAFVILFFSNRSANIAMIAKGIRHGLSRIRSSEFEQPL